MVIDYVNKFSVIPQLIYVNFQGRSRGDGLRSSQMISTLIKAIKIFWAEWIFSHKNLYHSAELGPTISRKIDYW